MIRTGFRAAIRYASSSVFTLAGDRLESREHRAGRCRYGRISPLFEGHIAWGPPDRLGGTTRSGDRRRRGLRRLPPSCGPRRVRTLGTLYAAVDTHSKGARAAGPVLGRRFG